MRFLQKVLKPLFLLPGAYIFHLKKMFCTQDFYAHSETSDTVRQHVHFLRVRMRGKEQLGHCSTVQVHGCGQVLNILEIRSSEMIALLDLFRIQRQFMFQEL